MNCELGIMNGGTCSPFLKGPCSSSVRRSSFVIRHSFRAFTLVELLVVVGMIAIIMGALTTSVASAMQRARIQKATADVKMLTQAIQAYANYNKGNLDETKGNNGWEDADFRNQVTLKAMNGSDENVPVLIKAALKSDGKMYDPWGNPYQIKITKGTIAPPNISSIETGYYLPNFYRLTEEERK